MNVRVVIFLVTMLLGPIAVAQETPNAALEKKIRALDIAHASAIVLGDLRPWTGLWMMMSPSIIRPTGS